jgi:hypothetical protein
MYQSMGVLMEVNDWLISLKEKLNDYDLYTLIDILDITPQQLIERFDDIIEDRAEEIANEIGYMP